MVTREEEKEIIEQYTLEFGLTSFQRILYYFSCLTMCIWFLMPVYSPDKLPLWVIFVVFPPIVFLGVATLPKYFKIMTFNSTFYELRWDPILTMKCTFAAAYPPKELLAKYPWLKLLHIVFILFPILCFAISFLVMAGIR